MEELFTNTLGQITSKLTIENLVRLKYLCKDFIPDGDREKITTVESLLLELERRGKISPNDVKFLENCLQTIARKDLVELLKKFESEREVCIRRGSVDSNNAASGESSKQMPYDKNKAIDDAEKYNERGRVEFQKKNFETALQQYTCALECLAEDQEENKVKYLCNRAACFVNLRKFKEGHQDCNEALLLKPCTSKARFRLAQCLEGEGNISEAFMEITSLLESNPRESAVIKLHKSLEEKIKENEEKAREKNKQGIRLFQQALYKEAVRKFTEGIELFPRLPAYSKDVKQLHWYRAECRLREDKLEPAQKDCEEALRLVPNDPVVLYTLLQVLEKLNNYKECYRIAQQLIDLKFKEKEANDTIERLLTKLVSDVEESQKKQKKKKKSKSKKKRKTHDGGVSDGPFVSKGVEDGDHAVASGDAETSNTVLKHVEGDVETEGAVIDVDSLSLVEESDEKSDKVEMRSFSPSVKTDDHSTSKDAVGEVDNGSSKVRPVSGRIQQDSSTVLTKTAKEISTEKPQGTGMSDGDNRTFSVSKRGDTYPRRILFLCDQWSSWHRSVCIINKQLCRSFAKFKDVQVACLVLEATHQDKVAATRDGINLITALPRTGITDKQLLCLHDSFPFHVDLVVGYGMVTGPAAAWHASSLKCRRLHIFYHLPGNEPSSDVSSTQESEDAEKKLGLTADFVAAVGPLLVDEWSMNINRKVLLIIPGMPQVSPRNAIPCPQCRCLILGNMSHSEMLGLDLAVDALLKCREREKKIKFIVEGAERERINELQEYLSQRCRSSHVDVAVKQVDVSSEAVGVEIRSVSLVLMPSRSEGFGLLALEAISAGVPVLLPTSSGLAILLQDHFDGLFLDMVCAVANDEDCTEKWSTAIDAILDDREGAFNLTANLREKWKSKFTWDLAARNLVDCFAASGYFSLPSPSAGSRFALPSECSESALKFIKEDVDLLNRRRKQVLFLSPESASECPYIQYFAHVPWVAVFDFDINSTKTGYLASCENFCERMGMKVCRILPPLSCEDRKKFSTGLSNGIPWVLLEGMPESPRSIEGRWDWVSEFFGALGKIHPVPITITVLWRSTAETKVLSKKLAKILTVVQVSPFYDQAKLVLASTGQSHDHHLEDIAEDWKAPILRLDLEDICNALQQCISSSPFVQENLDFALPVADRDDSQSVLYDVLPPSSRWIHAEMEVLYLSVGSTPTFECEDAYHFYRGGLISWYAIQMGYAVERSNWKSLKKRIDDLLMRAGTMRLKMPHQRGAGGTTSARKMLFDYHEKYPCVFLKSVNHAEVAAAIKVLAAFCRLPVIILVDCKQVYSDEFDVDMLYNSLSNDRIPSVILEVVYHSKQREGSEKSEKSFPVRLADLLDDNEAQEFVKMYSCQRKEKLNQLRHLRGQGQPELQIPFFYALITFEDRFTGLEPFVRDCLKGLGTREKQILLFLAIAYHYGHNSLLANDFAKLMQAPRREVISLESLLPDMSKELLLEEDGKWRPRHDLLAVEMLRQLLTLENAIAESLVHPDNWRNQLAVKAIDFFTHMPENVVSDVLLSRISDDKFQHHPSFSHLIIDIPLVEDVIMLFEKAISDFPDNPFFKVHLGRYYSIQKKSAGFAMAIKYTDEGISCSQDYPRLPRGQFAQMKGVVYSREVNYLIEQDADIDKIIEMADEGVKNFRRAVSIAPDFVDGYIPEVRMMCKVFEYIDKRTGNFCDYVKSTKAHPFIIDAISNTSNTLECVPDSDEYAHWRMRLACLGRRKFTPGKEMETLKLLFDLRDSGKASRGSINCQIVIMNMDICIKKLLSFEGIAVEMIELLNEALKFNSNWEQTMRLWVRLAPFIPIALSEAESKVFEWCSREKSVRSYLYKYIIACLHLLEGGSRNYTEIMKNTKIDLNSALKAISRPDVGRCRHPDRPVVWLGQHGRGMGHLVYLDENTSEVKHVRMNRFMSAASTKQLRPLTGIIVETGPKVGMIRVNGGLEVSFRTDLCKPPLVSSAFNNRKVKFFLAFNFFGTDAYNVQLVAE